MIKKYLARFPHAFRGITHALKNDSSYRHQFYLGLLIFVVVLVAFNPIEAFEFLFLTLAWFLILITELQNSALESALDKIHPEQHSHIENSKDMAAGAVLLAGIFLLIVVTVIAHNHLF